MKNLTEFNKFIAGKSENVIAEGAQLSDSQGTEVWRVRTRVEIPTKLINEYVKKIQTETGEDVRKKISDQEIAEDITNYITTAFLSIENLPSSIVTSVQKSPTVQAQEEMPSETQVQAPVQEPAAQPAPAQEPAAQAPVQTPTAQPTAASVAQEVPAQAPTQSAI